MVSNLLTSLSNLGNAPKTYTQTSSAGPTGGGSGHGDDFGYGSMPMQRMPQGMGLGSMGGGYGGMPTFAMPYFGNIQRTSPYEGGGWGEPDSMSGTNPATTTNPVTSGPVGGAETTAIDPSQSTLSPNFAPYVYDMLSRGQGLANLPYQEYTGQRFAGPSQLQRQAFGGIGSLQNPEQFDTASRAYQAILGRAGGVGDYTPGQFNVLDAANPETVQSFMNPYQQQVVDIQKREAQRQADIARTRRGAQFAQAGSFGGSRQAIEDAEAERNLQQQMGDIQATGGQAAFKQAMESLANQRMASLQGQQYGEISRQFGANLGLGALNPALQAASGLTNVGTAGLGGLQNIYNQQLSAGQTQQQQAQSPLDFAYQQFQESMKYPYQQTSYMQSLLQGLPLQARPYDSGQSGLASALQGGLSGLALYNMFNKP